MRSPDVCCPNMDCPESGQTGQGNMRIHGQTKPRCTCQVCGQTFSARAGTPCLRRRTAAATITYVVTLVGQGCPVPALAAAFGFQAQSVRAWGAASGAQCARLQHAQVVQPRDRLQVHADELRRKPQAGVRWLALALLVMTRVWLGGTSSARRDRSLLARLVAVVSAGARCGPVLCVTDGRTPSSDVYHASLNRFRRVFKCCYESLPSGMHCCGFAWRSACCVAKSGPPNNRKFQ